MNYNIPLEVVQVHLVVSQVAEYVWISWKQHNLGKYGIVFEKKEVVSQYHNITLPSATTYSGIMTSFHGHVLIQHMLY